VRCSSTPPRDRDGSFQPQIVKKRQRRFVGFDEKILALYSRGMSMRDIEAHLAEIYGVKVGRELISKVTDAVMDDVREWAKRPLEDIYPIVLLDCMVLKIREGATVQRRALYLALGVTLDGDRDVLGMWFQETEAAKFWMQILTDLKQRGVKDILIADPWRRDAQSRRYSTRPWFTPGRLGEQWPEFLGPNVNCPGS
jgi:putative transposase